MWISRTHVRLLCVQMFAFFLFHLGRPPVSGRINTTVTHTASDTRRRKNKQFKRDTHEGYPWGMPTKVIPPSHLHLLLIATYSLQANARSSFRFLLSAVKVASHKINWIKQYGTTKNHFLNRLALGTGSLDPLPAFCLINIPLCCELVRGSSGLLCLASPTNLLCRRIDCCHITRNGECLFRTGRRCRSMTAPFGRWSHVGLQTVHCTNRHY